MDPIITTHAKKRCQHRGVQQATVRAVLKFADLEFAGHEGRRRIQLSHAGVALMRDGGLRVDAIEAARKIALIVDDLDRVVTVLKLTECARRPRFARAIGARATSHGRRR